MSLAQFNQLVSNEQTSISRKNKEEWQGIWHGHILMASNEGTGNEGKGGAPRRTVTYQFRNVIPEKDYKGNLAEEIVAEEFPFLESCLHRCRDEVEEDIKTKHGGSGGKFMSIIHPFLKESAEEANRDNDHVLAFLQMLEEEGGIGKVQPPEFNHEKQCKVHPSDYYCHLEWIKNTLWEAYLATLSQSQQMKARHDMDQKNSLISALESKGLVVDKTRVYRPWPPYILEKTEQECLEKVRGKPKQGRYVYGVSLYRPPNSNASEDYQLLQQRPWEEDYVKPLDKDDQFNR
jgi:hypothetical protein